MKAVILPLVVLSLAGCATLTEDAMTPIALSFSDGSAGTCKLNNKRAAYQTEIPTTLSVRKSDDALKYDCTTKDGRTAVGSIDSEMGAKIVASAVFIDLGITDAITDKHRQYPTSFVIPIKPREGAEETSGSVASDANKTTEGDRQAVYSQLETLNSLRERGLLTDEEYGAEKKKLLEGQ